MCKDTIFLVINVIINNKINRSPTLQLSQLLHTATLPM